MQGLNLELREIEGGTHHKTLMHDTIVSHQRYRDYLLPPMLSVGSNIIDYRDIAHKRATSILKTQRLDMLTQQ